MKRTVSRTLRFFFVKARVMYELASAKNINTRCQSRNTFHKGKFMKLLTVTMALIGALIALQVQAHHSFAAQYDRNAELALEGIVTKVEWTNPHAHIYLDVTGSDGTVANWNLELASPNMLIRNGWKRDSLVANDHITVTASHARDGTNTAAVVLITRDDGSELTFISGDDR